MGFGMDDAPDPSPKLHDQIGEQAEFAMFVDESVNAKSVFFFLPLAGLTAKFATGAKHGCGVGVGVGDGVALADADGVGVGLGVAVGLGEGLGVATGPDVGAMLIFATALDVRVTP